VKLEKLNQASPPLWMTITITYPTRSQLLSYTIAVTILHNRSYYPTQSQLLSYTIAVTILHNRNYYSMHPPMLISDGVAGCHSPANRYLGELIQASAVATPQLRRQASGNGGSDSGSNGMYLNSYLISSASQPRN
jgi:hypothetical protein